MYGENWYTITGGIDANTAQNLVTFINNQIFNSGLKRLKLIISSSGGDLDAAIRIYSFLKAAPIDVETIGFTQIDSAANIIFLSGSKRLATKDCRFFLHESMYGTFQPGDMRRHEEAMKVIKQLEKRNIEIISSETSKTPKKVDEILKKGTVFTAMRAKSFGLATEIITKIPLVRQIPVVNPAIPV